MPVSSSGSRTAIGESAGGRSQVAGIVTGLAVVLVLFSLGGLLARFPIAALGGLVVFAGLRLIESRNSAVSAASARASSCWPSQRQSVCIVAGVLAGILIAVALSVVALFARVASPKAAVLGRPPGVAGLHDIPDYPDAVTVPGLVVFRYDAPWCSRTRMTSGSGRWKRSTRPAPVEWLLINAEANVELT